MTITSYYTHICKLTELLEEAVRAARVVPAASFLKAFLGRHALVATVEVLQLLAFR